MGVLRVPVVVAILLINKMFALGNRKKKRLNAVKRFWTNAMHAQQVVVAEERPLRLA
jgi:hypothetical protein